jgi:hypothetical protein
MSANRVTLLRFSFGAFCAVSLTAGAVLVAQRTALGQAGTIGSVSSALLGAALAVIWASILEWIVHRHIYHHCHLGFLKSIYRVHHVGHHRLFFPPTRYAATGEAKRFALDSQGDPHVFNSVWKNRAMGLLHFTFYISIGAALLMTPLWLLTRNIILVAGAASASALIAHLFIAVHDAIHHPEQHRVIQAQPWFEFLNNHHLIHHIDTEANVNFLLPLGDLIFGSLRLSLSTRELVDFGTASELRKHPVGFDQPVSELKSKIDGGGGIKSVL